MSRALMLIVLGVLVMLSPFSGLPMSILTWILPVFGLIAIAVGVSYKRERAQRDRVASSTYEASLSGSV